MPNLTLRHVVVGAAKADFVKHSVRVSLDLPLNDETLKLRSKLAYLAMEKESITVTPESAQLPLFEEPAASKSENDIAASVEDESHGVILTGERVFNAVLDHLETEAAQPAPKGKRGNKKSNGSVTIEHDGRSVTLSNAQFDRAARTAGRKSRKSRK